MTTWLSDNACPILSRLLRLEESFAMRLHHREAGAGPTVLLLHAGMADSRMWEPQLRSIGAAGRRSVAVDLPGFGESPACDDRPVHESVLETADALGIGDFDLAGCSMGAHVAIDIARASPSRIRSLVLVCPGLGGVEPAATTEELWRREEQAIESGDLESATEIGLEMWIAGPDRRLADLDALFVEHVRELALLCNRRQAEATSWPQFAEPPVDEALEQIEVSTLIIGATHDQPHLAEVCAMAARRLPHARLVTIGTGHLPNLEQPQEFDRLFLAHLEQTARQR
jgi:3-oxoadipate enol-lactonase